MKQKNKGTVIVTNAGGVGVVCLDLISSSGLDLYTLESDLEQKLVAILPKSASIKNPIDILGDSKSDRYQKVLEILIKETKIQSIIVVVTPQIMTDSANVANVVVELAKNNPNMPIIPVFMGDSLVLDSFKIFKKNKFPCYNSPESAINSLKKYLDYRSKKEIKLDAAAKELKASVDVAKNDQILSLNNVLESIKKTSLDYLNTQKIARLFDIPTTDFCLITKDGNLDLVLAKEFLGKHLKVVIKVVSAGILHRSEQKMVELNITSLNQIQDFYNKFKDLKPDIVLQEMVESGVQCFIGVNRDPQFGPTLIVGTGGVYAEIMDDFVLIPLPTSKDSIEQYLEQTKLYKVLNGARNEFWDILELVETVYKLSKLLDYFPKISSIDINPYFAMKNGGKVVDFKVVLE